MKTNVSEYLKNNGIKPSLQRIRIYEYLINNKNHPTVDQVYNELVEEMPTLSKTTIYNTFKLFMEKGIITIITIEENETRYDADTSFHGHFKCDDCGEVYDFDIDSMEISNNAIKGFETKERHLYLKGRCRNCLGGI